MNNKEYKFLSIVKEKAITILVIDMLLTFVVVKVIDFILNYFLNKEMSSYGIATYNFTISFFSPVFFIIFFIIITLVMKKKENRRINQPVKKVKPEYYGNYVWKDIFRDRVFFAFFCITAFGVFAVLYYLTQWIAGLSTNYAIASFEWISIDYLIILSIIIASVIVVFIQNTLISWLMNTQKGNQLLSKLVFAFGIVTLCFMCGINYLWTSSQDVATSIQEDFYIGAIIPFDMTTMFFGLLTLFLAKIARNVKNRDKKMVRLGVVIAIVSIIISFTPLQMVIQLLVIALRHGTSLMNMNM